MRMPQGGTHPTDRSPDAPASRERTLDIKPWMLPLIVAAITVPIVVGFVVAGPILGLALGFVVAAMITVLAARQRPGGPIEAAVAEDLRRYVLVVVSHELDAPDAIDQLRRGAHLVNGDETAEVRVLAPAKMNFLDRWATDVGPAREEAQRKLVISVASLEKADVPSEATVGDESIVQAVEDELRSFPATQVVLVTGTPDTDPEGTAAARELERRLERPFQQITIDGSSASEG
jgi:hypothetical protein